MKFNHIEFDCPWRTIQDKCKVTKNDCDQEECAIWIFIRRHIHEDHQYQTGTQHFGYSTD